MRFKVCTLNNHLASKSGMKNPKTGKNLWNCSDQRFRDIDRSWFYYMCFSMMFSISLILFGFNEY